MSKQKIVTGALIILAASMITRVLGFVFRIYISNRLGAEGMGLYQLVLSLYMLLVTFATNGIAIAVSKMVAEQQEVNRYGGTRPILRMAVAYSLLVSIAAAIALFWFACPIGEFLLKDERTILSLRCLAPSLPFMAVSSCIKGYFYAMRDSFKPSSAQVIEQVAKMIFIIFIIGLWLPYGDAFACAATVLGMTVGEIVSCAYVVMTYYADRKKTPKTKGKQRKIIKEFIHISLPIQTSSTFHSLLRLAENLLIIGGLRIFTGGDDSSAIGAYGILKGMVLPLLMFPTSLLQALVTTLIPEVASANAGGKRERIRRAVNKVLQLTLMMSVVIVLIFMLFPHQIGNMLYHEPQVGNMLALLCPICPLMYLEMVTVGVLNAIGEQVAPMRYNIADSIIRIILIYFFVPKGGIQAFLWIMIVSNLFTSLLNLRRLLKVTKVKFKWKNWIILPTVAAAAAAFPAKILYAFFFDGLFPVWFCVCLCSVIVVMLYIGLLFAMKCITPGELHWVRDCFKRKKSDTHFKKA